MAVAIAMTRRDDSRVHPFFKEQSSVEALIDPNYGRRKRQKSASPASDLFKHAEVPRDHGRKAGRSAAARKASASPTALGEEDSKVSGLPAAGPRQSTQAMALEVRIDNSRQRTSNSVDASAQVDSNAPPPAPEAEPEMSSPPKKMLQVRSDGKLSSPKGVAPSKPKRGRKSMASKAEERRAEGIVIIKYGRGKKARRALGARINAILATAPRPNLPHAGAAAHDEVDKEARATHPFFTGGAQAQGVQSALAATGVEERSNAPPMPTHPFFTGEAQKKTITSVAASTAEADLQAEKKAREALENPKKARVNSKPPGAGKKDDAEGSASFPTFGTDHAKLHRFPGAKDPIWPPSGFSHVRPEVEVRHSPSPGQVMRRTGRKLKSIPLDISVDEDVFCPLRHELARCREQMVCRSTTVPEAIRSFREPKRHVLSGEVLQGKVKARLLCNLTSTPSQIDSEADELGEPFPNRRPSHPAVTRLYDRLRTAKSAFDNFECELKMWSQKYAPQRAEDVLQEGPEATLLRDWLKSLIVSSVNVQSSSNILQRRLKAHKKKRKRKDELDDFIASSDDEMTELATLDSSETGDGGTISSAPRTVIQQKDGKSQLMGTSTHASIISGPHGCGKSATVYAIANELGFEVFEINAGSRRSGRDILERVGDMTQNHLVHNEQSEEPLPSQNEADEARHAEKLSEDIASGKQKTMGSFFKSKPVSKKKTSPRKAEKQKDVAVSEARVKEPRSQRQSLILLEEVDILFEEDKAFWTTIMELIINTRRPVIMTCTNEGLLPMDEMSLYGIFRFSSPPKNVAIDYMLLLAALEGHLLEREALRALYEAKSGDLRAALMELQFHSQMAIGDRKGGLNWMLIQSPSEVQAQQPSTESRVISGDTYQCGMGWLGGEIPNQKSAPTLEERVDMLMLGINEWALDTGDLAMPIPLARGLGGSDPKLNFRELEALDQGMEALSMSDLLPVSQTRRSKHFSVDSTQPEMPEHLRGHFIEKPALIQADILEEQTAFASTLALALCVLVNQLCQPEHPFNTAPQESMSEAVINGKKSSPNVEPEPEYIKMSRALDILATSKTPSISTLDSPASTIATEIAPYVRSIAAYDLRLAEQRQQLSAAFAQPGREQGKARKTRASLAALEGGNKASTRKQRWLPVEMDYGLVLDTGGKGWQEFLQNLMQTQDPIKAVDGDVDMEVLRASLGSQGTESMADELCI